jgi:hypothetical protein
MRHRGSTVRPFNFRIHRDAEPAWSRSRGFRPQTWAVATAIDRGGIGLKTEETAPRLGCSRHFGRASAPTMPHRVHTIRAPIEDTGTWSGHRSALSTAWWWQVQQLPNSDRAVLAHVAEGHRVAGGDRGRWAMGGQDTASAARVGCPVVRARPQGATWAPAGPKIVWVRPAHRAPCRPGGRRPARSGAATSSKNGTDHP